jgi:hypothetical protein
MRHRARAPRVFFIWGLRGIFATGFFKLDISGRMNEITQAFNHFQA